MAKAWTPSSWQGFPAEQQPDWPDQGDLDRALKQIASINRNIKKFDIAKEYEKKVIAIAPNDPEAYYTVGCVDWVLAY